MGTAPPVWPLLICFIEAGQANRVGPTGPVSLTAQTGLVGPGGARRRRPGRHGWPPTSRPPLNHRNLLPRGPGGGYVSPREGIYPPREIYPPPGADTSPPRAPRGGYIQPRALLDEMAPTSSSSSPPVEGALAREGLQPCPPALKKTSTIYCQAINSASAVLELPSAHPCGKLPTTTDTKRMAVRSCPGTSRGWGRVPFRSCLCSLRRPHDE